MKRGFLLRAEAKKVAAKRRLAPSTPAAESPPVQQNPKVLKLDYGNLTAEEKSLPNDYDRVSKVTPKLTDASITEYGENMRVVTSIPQPVPNDETQCQWIVNGSTKAKVLNAPGYPARIPKPRLPDLYEIRSTPDMGKGLFAKRNVKCGDLIFAERPLLVAPRTMKGTRTAIPDHYTDQQIKQIMMLEYESFLEYSVSRLSSQCQADFRALHNAHTGDGSGPLLGIIRSNSYHIGNLYDGPHKTPNGVYQVVCNIGSRINHNCVPNVRYRFKINSFSIQFYATRDIKAGEQLFYAYCKVQSTAAQRKVELAPYGIVCKCPACVDGPANDKLRTTVGAQMAYLTTILENASEINEALLEDAVRLEKDILKEGLHPDVPTQFVGLLAAISLGYAKLKKPKESEKYGVLVEEFQKYLKNDE